MNNIETFNLLVGLVLTDLYENFPVPVELSAAGFAKAAGFWDGTGLCPEETFQKAQSALDWLVNDGFVREALVNTGLSTFRKTHVLTLQGLRLLSLPKSLENHESIGEALKKAAQGGLKDGVKGSVGEIVKKALLEGYRITLEAALSGAMQGLKG